MCVLKWPAKRFTWLVTLLDISLIAIGVVLVRETSPGSTASLSIFASTSGLAGSLIITCGGDRRSGKRWLPVAFLVIAMLYHAPLAASTLQEVSKMQGAVSIACESFSGGKFTRAAIEQRLAQLMEDGGSKPTQQQISAAFQSSFAALSAPKLLRRRAMRPQCQPALGHAVFGSRLDLLFASAVLTVIAALLEAFCVMRVWKEDTERGHACSRYLWGDDDLENAHFYSRRSTRAAVMEAEMEAEMEVETLLEEARRCTMVAPGDVGMRDLR